MDGLYKYFGLRKDKRPQLRLFIQAAGPTTHAAQPAGSSNQAAEPPQPVTPGPIRSNRTVTRDLKRQECKEILQRKEILGYKVRNDFNDEDTEIVVNFNKLKQPQTRGAGPMTVSQQRP